MLDIGEYFINIVVSILYSRTNYRLVILSLILVIIILFWYVMCMLCLLKIAKSPSSHMVGIDSKDFLILGNL